MRILFLLCLFASCAKFAPEKTIATKIPLAVCERPFFLSHDTISSSGNFLRYRMKENSIWVHWGNDSVSRWWDTKTTPDWFRYSLDFEMKNFLALRAGCGSPCWTITLLPLSQNDSVQEYHFDLAHDSKNNLICISGGNDCLTILSALTKKKTEIHLDSIQPWVWPGGTIDSISFVNEQLFVRWKTSDYENPFHEKKFPIIH
jgi:hypothetical protein